MVKKRILYVVMENVDANLFHGHDFFFWGGGDTKYINVV